MATPIKIGGSANIILDLELSQNWELTGLDVSGNVLQQINVQIKQSIVPSLTMDLTLPTISSLNNRTCTYYIDSNDYGADIQINAGLGDTINGNANTTISYLKNSVTPLTSSVGDNWILPVIQQ